MSYFGKECQLHTGSLLKAMIRVTYKLSCPAVTRWNSTGVIGASSDQVPFAVRRCTPLLLLCFFVDSSVLVDVIKLRSYLHL